jgi:hypothetical protein
VSQKAIIRHIDLCAAMKEEKIFLFLLSLHILTNQHIEEWKSEREINRKSIVKQYKMR